MRADKSVLGIIAEIAQEDGFFVQIDGERLIISLPIGGRVPGNHQGDSHAES